jgi:hypothetical protein
MSLYPKTQGNARLAANVVKMLDQAIGTAQTTADAPPANTTESADYLDEKRS